MHYILIDLPVVLIKLNAIDLYLFVDSHIFTHKYTRT